MQIVIVRHLPTEWNEKGLLQGSKDIPINERKLPEFDEEIVKNQQQLERLEPFGAVFASSLSRAQQTAQVYGFHDHRVDGRLNELHFGSFEGRPKRELQRLHSEQWNLNPRSMTLGERLIDFEKRIFSFLQDWREKERILVFGHGSWIRGLLSIAQTGQINQMNQFNVANNELKVVDLFLPPTGGWNADLSEVHIAHEIDNIR